jgi:hypothetical protein
MEMSLIARNKYFSYPPPSAWCKTAWCKTAWCILNKLLLLKNNNNCWYGMAKKLSYRITTTIRTHTQNDTKIIVWHGIEMQGKSRYEGLLKKIFVKFVLQRNRFSYPLLKNALTERKNLFLLLAGTVFGSLLDITKFTLLGKESVSL